MKNETTGAMRILAQLKASLKASRDLTGGILHYAAIHPDVTVQLFGEGTAHPNHLDFRAWKPDGIIVNASDAPTMNLIKSLGCGAAIFVNTEAPDAASLRCASVFCDNKAVAQAAIRLFTDKGIGRFAFVHTLEREQWADERSRTMRECAERLGCPFSAFDMPRTGRRKAREALSMLASWISSLPKPCGILAANDSRAKDVLDACREAGVSIPDQVMVLGVDNEDFICSQMQPTLSSIVPDFHQGGYLAAHTATGSTHYNSSHDQPLILYVKCTATDYRIPYSFIAFSSLAALASSISVSGSLTLPFVIPRSCVAFLTGIGLTSQNRALQRSIAFN